MVSNLFGTLERTRFLFRDMLAAVRHLVELLARDPDNPPLAAGEIVSTGTLTRAFPVKAGETWTTKLKGIDLEGASLRLE